jgi:hypothetical protein
MQHVTGTVDPCACGVCGADVPPLIGSILTGSGLTLSQAADRLEADEPLQLTELQLRLVERHAEERIAQ